MREARVEAALVRQVKERGGMCLKFVSPGRRHVPDRIVLWPGPARVHFVELKAPGKAPRPGQQREIARLMSMGFPVYVLDTIEQVAAYVRRHA